jgi:aminoglycoside phosphotransferase (APT) family kinase protein
VKRFPSRAEDLTPDLLSSVIADKQPGVVVESFELVETSQVGDGFASTADRVALRLRYAEGADGGLPERMLLKTMLLRPHAPEAMYRNEVRFYNEIRPEITIEAPRGYGCLFDEETAQFGILMEDLALRGASFPNATTQVSQPQIRSLLSHLAELHAAYWQSPRFERDLAWVATPMQGGMFPVVHGFGIDFIRDQVEQNPFKQELIAPLGRDLGAMWADLWKQQERLASEPATLLHGDPHIGNTYLLSPEHGGFLDWQLMVRGRWAHDVTYLLVTSQSIDDRRKHERELLAGYLDALRSRGVATAPSFDEAWLLYRQSAIWGLMIGWLITPPSNYGEAITTANLERLVAAVQDLETFEALR